MARKTERSPRRGPSSENRSADSGSQQPAGGRQPGFSIVERPVVEALHRVSASAVRLAVALGKFADGSGYCFPTVRTLMPLAGILEVLEQ